ncbi:MAG: AbrB/MazE/SpoVT family DNA-binding domain-containing protein [Desulfobacterales bacterium]|nr:AbrB/MazE/SpoVT family DNA-binding domain-containing protein [Desulfobacterales bacterium]
MHDNGYRLPRRSRITLPAAACREAGIKPHDRVLVEVREGVIVIEVRPTLMSLEGTLGRALLRGKTR